ncbi:MAG: 7-cyano-7-deazaguanine synthase QueC [Chloroflexi bacterium]|nr:7-cyano-7-deazaguanine synthase QueC [Chloroflexota bacterium]
MDSVTLAHVLHSEGYALHLLSIDYGQRHRKELEYARLCAQRLNAEYNVVDLSGINVLLKGSALTDSTIEVPEGHYAAPNMGITVVPNRNAIMLAVAYAAAVAENAEVVALGAHGGDHFIYPDCRPAFTEAFDQMQKLAVEGFGNPKLRLYTPFINSGKHDIAAIGTRLGVPFAETWSCYKGGEKHCGKCGTCVERKEAFQLAGVPDPTEYEA